MEIEFLTKIFFAADVTDRTATKHQDKLVDQLSHRHFPLVVAMDDSIDFGKCMEIGLLGDHINQTGGRFNQIIGTVAFQSNIEVIIEFTERT